MSEDALPTSRPSLLRTFALGRVWPHDEVETEADDDGLDTEEVRIGWIQTQHRAEGLYAKIKNIILSSVESAEVKLGMVSPLSSRFACRQARLLTGTLNVQILDLITGSAEHAKTRSGEKWEEGKAYADEKASSASARGAQNTAEAKAKAGEAESAGKKYWNQKVEDAKRAADHVKVEL